MPVIDRRRARKWCRPSAAPGASRHRWRARTSSMRLVQPVEVSLCTTQTALMRCAVSAASAAPIAATSAPRRQSVSMNMRHQSQPLAPSPSTGWRTSRCGTSAQCRPATGCWPGRPPTRRCRRRGRSPPGRRSGRSARRLARICLPKRAEIGAAMVHGGIVDRAQHAVRHVGRAGDLQEMPPGGAACARNRPSVSPLRPDNARRMLLLPIVPSVRGSRAMTPGSRPRYDRGDRRFPAGRAADARDRGRGAVRPRRPRPLRHRRVDLPGRADRRDRAATDRATSPRHWRSRGRTACRCCRAAAAPASAARR